RVIHHTNAGELVVVRPQIARHDLRPAGDPQAEDAAGELHAGDVDVLRAADVDRRSAGAGRVDDRRSAAVDRHPLAIADVDRLVASAGHGDRVRAGDVQRAQGALDGLGGIAVDRHIGGPRSPRRCAEYQPGKCRQRYPPAPFGYFVHGNLPYTLSHHSTIAWRPWGVFFSERFWGRGVPVIGPTEKFPAGPFRFSDACHETNAAPNPPPQGDPRARALRARRGPVCPAIGTRRLRRRRRGGPGPRDTKRGGRKPLAASRARGLGHAKPGDGAAPDGGGDGVLPVRTADAQPP